MSGVPFFEERYFMKKPAPWRCTDEERSPEEKRENLDRLLSTGRNRKGGVLIRKALQGTPKRIERSKGPPVYLRRNLRRAALGWEDYEARFEAWVEIMKRKVEAELAERRRLEDEERAKSDEQKEREKREREQRRRKLKANIAECLMEASTTQGNPLGLGAFYRTFPLRSFYTAYLLAKRQFRPRTIGPVSSKQPLLELLNLAISEDVDKLMARPPRDGLPVTVNGSVDNDVKMSVYAMRTLERWAELAEGTETATDDPVDVWNRAVLAHDAWTGQPKRKSHEQKTRQVPEELVKPQKAMPIAAALPKGLRRSPRTATMNTLKEQNVEEGSKRRGRKSMATSPIMELTKDENDEQEMSLVEEDKKTCDAACSPFVFKKEAAQVRKLTPSRARHEKRKSRYMEFAESPARVQPILAKKFNLERNSVDEEEVRESQRKQRVLELPPGDSPSTSSPPKETKKRLSASAPTEKNRRRSRAPLNNSLVRANCAVDSPGMAQRPEVNLLKSLVPQADTPPTGRKRGAATPKPRGSERKRTAGRDIDAPKTMIAKRFFESPTTANLARIRALAGLDDTENMTMDESTLTPSALPSRRRSSAFTASAVESSFDASKLDTSLVTPRTRARQKGVNTVATRKSPRFPLKPL